MMKKIFSVLIELALVMCLLNGCAKESTPEWLLNAVSVSASPKSSGDLLTATPPIKNGDAFFVIANEKIYAENISTGEKIALCGHSLYPYGIGVGRMDIEGDRLFWTGKVSKKPDDPEVGVFAYDLKTGVTDQIIKGYEITSFCVQDDLICFSGAEDYSDINTIECFFGIYSISEKEIKYMIPNISFDTWFWVEDKIYGIISENNNIVLWIFDISQKEALTYRLEDLTGKKIERFADVKVSVSKNYIGILAECEDLSEQEKCIYIFDQKTLELIASVPRLERQFDLHSQAFCIFDVNSNIYIAQSADGKSVLHRLCPDQTLEECGSAPFPFNAYDFKMFDDGIYALNRMYNGDSCCFFNEHTAKLLSL